MNIKFINCENFLQGISALQEDMSFKVSNESDYSISFAESEEDILKVYEVFKKNQYGKYLKDVIDGKYQEDLY